MKSVGHSHRSDPAVIKNKKQAHITSSPLLSEIVTARFHLTGSEPENWKESKGQPHSRYDVVIHSVGFHCAGVEPRHRGQLRDEQRARKHPLGGPRSLQGGLLSHRHLVLRPHVLLHRLHVQCPHLPRQQADRQRLAVVFPSCVIHDTFIGGRKGYGRGMEDKRMEGWGRLPPWPLGLVAG